MKKRFNMKKTIITAMAVALSLTAIQGMDMNEATKVQAAEMLEVASTENVYEGFTYEVGYGDTVTILDYIGEDPIVTVPGEIDGKKVISIASTCFNYNNIVKEITFPSTIQSYGCIGYSCSQLEKITINAYDPGELTGMSFGFGNGLFADCPKLTTIIVNENDNFKSFYAKDNVLYFYGEDVDTLVLYPGGKRDTSYTFKESLQIGQSAFEGNKYIEKVVFEKPLVDHYTYNNETGNWDKVMETNCVFRWCTSLKEVEFTGLTEVGSWFDGCTSLEKCTIPDTVKVIKPMMFNGCTSLKELEIPATVEYIYSTLCQDCSSLEKCIVYNDNVEFEKDENGVPFSGIWNNCDKLVLYCNEGSTTEAYAKLYGKEYKYIKDIGAEEEPGKEPEISPEEPGKEPEVSPEEPHKHSYGDWKVLTVATCEKAGSKERECACGEKETETISATGHKWNAGKVTTKPTAVKKGEKTYICSVCKDEKIEEVAALGLPKKGKTFIVKGATYKVTKAHASKGTVTVVKAKANIRTIDIPATVKLDGVTYKVTAIEKNAFKNQKRVKTITIGSNVSKIGATAFTGCSKLKTIKISTTKLTKAGINKNAFKGIGKNVKIKVPKKKFNAYKKIFKSIKCQCKIG